MSAPRLFRDEAGASVIEFAIVAPLCILMLMGLIEMGRFLWVRHSLEEVAYTTARCMSISTACGDETAQQDFAIERARSFGIAITSGDVEIASNAECKGFAESNQVVISATFTSGISSILPAFPTHMRSESCFPQLTTES